MKENSQEMCTMESRQKKLLDLGGFFKKSWKIMLGGFFAGAMISASINFFSTPKYEASAWVEMAKIPALVSLNIGSNEAQAANIESPSRLAERLKIPSTYKPETILACGVGGEKDPSGSMVKIINVSTIKNLPSAVKISVQLSNSDLARKCISAVVKSIIDQQAEMLRPYRVELKATLEKLEKRLQENQDYFVKADKVGLYQILYLARRDELFVLRQQIDDLRRVSSRDYHARLVSPIYASPNRVSPSMLFAISLGAISGLMIGVMLSIGRIKLITWRLRTLDD